MYVRVTCKRIVSQQSEFIFDAKDESSLKEIEEFLNRDENAFKLSDRLDFTDDGITLMPYKVFRVKKKPSDEDTIYTHGELCSWK
jgi:hypothetical protein